MWRVPWVTWTAPRTTLGIRVPGKGPWSLWRSSMKTYNVILLTTMRISSCDEKLGHVNLSRVDVLDNPAAIKWSRAIIAIGKQDGSPNKLTNPEILMNIFTQIHVVSPGYCLQSSVAQWFSSCACIILLSETSSTSHLQVQQRNNHFLNNGRIIDVIMQWCEVFAVICR